MALAREREKYKLKYGEYVEVLNPRPAKTQKRRARCKRKREEI